MKLEIRACGTFTAAEKAFVDGWASQVFAGQDQGLVWATSDYRVLIWEGDELACSVEILERLARVGEQAVRLGGISGVATWPAYRRRGLARRAMQAAMDFLRLELKVEHGLLICGPHLIPFYQGLGWQVVPGPLVYGQPSGKGSFLDVIMIWPCRGQAWPAGVIDVCGLPW